MTEAVAGMVDLQAQYKMPTIGKIIRTITTFFGIEISFLKPGKVYLFEVKALLY